MTAHAEDRIVVSRAPILVGYLVQLVPATGESSVLAHSWSRRRAARQAQVFSRLRDGCPVLWRA